MEKERDRDRDRQREIAIQPANHSASQEEGSIRTTVLELTGKKHGGAFGGGDRDGLISECSILLKERQRQRQNVTERT